MSSIIDMPDMTASCALFSVTFETETCVHHGIFVQTSSDGTGTLFDARGSIGTPGALVFSARQESLPNFASCQARGKISSTNVPRLKSICEAVPGPDSQYPDNVAGNVCRCSEWCNDAWAAIRKGGVIN